MGTRYARFSSFSLNPVKALSYTKGLLGDEHSVHYGHTPAGSMMVILLLGLLGIQLATGMMSTDDIIWSGPFYNAVGETVSALAGEIHETVQGLLQLLVGLHILAIVLYKVKFGEPLVPAMIHGRKLKQDRDNAEHCEREPVSIIKFLIAVVPAAGFTYWLFSIPI
ncbi:cytochrome b/b6 domain-containing protein [Amphritea atlantica]|nr:cytochrome b/b6 domain-containing protein [Amphritea atlantica]